MISWHKRRKILPSIRMQQLREYRRHPREWQLLTVVSLLWLFYRFFSVATVQSDIIRNSRLATYFHICLTHAFFTKFFRSFFHRRFHRSRKFTEEVFVIFCNDWLSLISNGHNTFFLMISANIFLPTKRLITIVRVMQLYEIVRYIRECRMFFLFVFLICCMMRYTLQQQYKASGEQPDTMSRREAAMFPLISSVTLIGLYILYKVIIRLCENYHISRL